MDIRQITQDYAVSAQIAPEDIPEIREAGIRTIVCNRPDMENPVELQAGTLRIAAEAAGLAFVDNPVNGAAMTYDNVTAQADALAGADGPVLAYCASGTRSAVVWALAQAGSRPTDEILQATAAAGYPLEGLRQQIDALAGS